MSKNITITMMREIAFATTNHEKFLIASQTCAKAGLALQQISLDVDEIQGENVERIALDKAAKAYALHGKPVLISDDSWSIAGLNGFPGPYMKSINHWFRPEDLLRSTAPLKDRRITLTQMVIYKDARITKVFRFETPGILNKEIRGDYGSATHKLVILDGDNGRTMAEMHDSANNHADRKAALIWEDFAAWYDREFTGVPA